MGPDDQTRWLGRNGRGQKKAAAAVRGPERFYYDKSTYTGTHRNGGPDVLGNGLPKEGYGDLSELVVRDVIQDDDLNRRRRSAVLEEEVTREDPPLPRLLGAHNSPMVSKKTEMASQKQAKQAVWYTSAAPVVLTPM